jgi:hypothetical protein
MSQEKSEEALMHLRIARLVRERDIYDNISD